ncbi:MAG: hypothetical protein AB1454_07005 [Candidatus Auribacterota bacterium]
MRIFVITAALTFLLSVAAYSQQGDTEHLIGQGYFHLSKNEVNEARNCFMSAANQAQSEDSWQNSLDAALGLIAVRSFSDAAALVSATEAHITTINDMRADVALAYTIASLPPDYREDLDPAPYLSRAYDAAVEADNWRAVYEIAGVYGALGIRDEAIKALDAAMPIVIRNESEAGARDLAQSYKALGETGKEKECLRLKQQFAASAQPAASTPPPGWSPYGESIAGPAPLPEKTAVVYADHQQTAPREYARPEDNQDMWDYYNPFYYGYANNDLCWSPFWDYADSHLSIWGSTRLGGFVYTNGHYRRRW